MWEDTLLRIMAAAYKVWGSGERSLQQLLLLPCVLAGRPLHLTACAPPLDRRRTREPCTAGCCVSRTGCAPVPAGLAKRTHRQASPPAAHVNFIRPLPPPPAKFVMLSMRYTKENVKATKQLRYVCAVSVRPLPIGVRRRAGRSALGGERTRRQFNSNSIG